MSRARWLACHTAVAMIVTAPAFAQDKPPANRQEEISAIRAEMARMAARLDRLEAEDAADAAAPRQIGTAAPTRGATPLPATVAYAPPRGLEDSHLPAAAIENRAVAPATFDRSLQSSGFGFQLNASTDATNVAIKLGRDTATSNDTQSIYTSIAATISAPLSTSGTQSDIGTLDGFINSSKLRIQLSRYIRTASFAPDAPGYDALVAEGRSRCRAMLSKTASECAVQIITSQFFNTYAPDLETAFLGMSHMTAGPKTRPDWSAIAFGIEGSVGYKNYKYILPGPARGTDTDRVPFGAKLFLSYLPDVRRNAITGGIEFQRSFKEGTSGALCPVAIPSAEISCLTGALSAPTRNNKLILSGEYRHRWVFKEDSFIPMLGISGQLSYDALNDDFGVDVPIYLAGDSKGLLSGGVRFGYRTKGDDFVAGVFVGTAFTLR